MNGNRANQLIQSREAFVRQVRDAADHEQVMEQGLPRRLVTPAAPVHLAVCRHASGLHAK